MTLLRILLLVLIAVLASSAQGQDRPASKPLWRYVDSKNFEPENPGLGVSYHFEFATSKANIYFYDERQQWADGLSDPKFDKAFLHAASALKMAEQQGQMENLEAGPIVDITHRQIPLRLQTFTFRLRGSPQLSRLYMTAMNGKLLKYRITVRASFSESMDLQVDNLLIHTLFGVPDFEAPWLSKPR